MKSEITSSTIPTFDLIMTTSGSRAPTNLHISHRLLHLLPPHMFSIANTIYEWLWRKVSNSVVKFVFFYDWMFCFCEFYLKVRKFVLLLMQKMCTCDSNASVVKYNFYDTLWQVSSQLLMEMPNIPYHFV